MRRFLVRFVRAGRAGSMHVLAGSSIDALLLALGIFGDELEQQPHRISVRPA